MVYLVSYDLRKPGQDYKGLFAELEASSSWWHYLASTWLIATSESANELYNRLQKNLDRGDRLLIIQAGTDMQGWLPKKAWEWIERELLGVR
jgi:hypothetical protein